MNQINDLLNDAQSTYKQQLNETKAYVSKWEKTGLLEGIDKDYEKHNTSILLENQARQLISENSKVGSAGSKEEWNGVALPLVRRIFGEIFAKEFVSIQPMNLPSGLVFWLDFKYGTDKGYADSTNRRFSGDVMGNTSSSSAPTGGLYGAGIKGKEGYSINLQTKKGTLTSVGVLAGVTDVDVDLFRGAYFVSTSGTVFTSSAATSLKNGDAADTLTFRNALIASANPLMTGTASYFSDTETAASRGDFEDNAGSALTDTLNIPEMNVELRQEALVAKTRKLKVVWSPEFAQDLNAYHSIDAEAELTSMLSEYISMEIDMEILAMLDQAALHTGETFALSSAAKGYSPIIADATARYDFGSWAQTLGYQMQKVSNQIHKSTMRGGANFAVCSPEIASILESIPGFAADTDGTASQFAAGVTKVGSFANRYTIYKNPYRETSDGILMGFRGNQFLETGAVYAPYIPLIMTPLIYDPTNFTPRKGVMTRYAKKVVRPEFYGKVAVTIEA